MMASDARREPAIGLVYWHGNEYPDEAQTAEGCQCEGTPERMAEEWVDVST